MIEYVVRFVASLEPLLLGWSRDSHLFYVFLDTEIVRICEAPLEAC